MGTALEQQDTRKLNLIFEKEDIKKKAKFFRKNIVSWYLISGRKFPWRESNVSPYAKLIAEIFLQKTRAENIVDVYNKFLESFPTIDDLAKADNKSIESIIQPLGLQKARSKNLLGLANELAKNNSSEIPSKQEELLKLPGIGIYIANAYLISQYKIKSPVVDTNFNRVYSRFFSVPMKGDPRRNPFLLKFAEYMLPDDHFKEYTFGVLDFAALICQNKNPKCNDCLVNKFCDYFQQIKKKSI